MHTGCSHIIYMQKLAHGFTTAPYPHFTGPRLFGFVEPPHHGGDYVAVFGVEVIVLAVEVGGHCAAIVPAILAVVTFAEFDASNFGNGIGLIGWLECSGQQCIFLHRLLGHFRINTRRAKEQQLLNPRHVCGGPLSQDIN